MVTIKSMCLFISILSIIIPVTWTSTFTCSGSCYEYTTRTCADGEACILNCNYKECDNDRRRRSLLQGRSLLQLICGGGCKNMVLYCASGQSCTVNANGGDSEGLEIHAEDASSLQINNCGSDCDKIKIYCPQNGRYGTDGLCNLDINSDVDDVEIYTQESIHDLDVSYGSGDDLLTSTLHCGANQEYSCTLDDHGTNCISSSSSPCKDGYRLPTAAPTNDPTTSPSKDPTKSPSKDPTKAPTKTPTKDPTLSPTNPTTSPTRKPTTDPTADPTKNPTAGPTKGPTKSPTPAPTDSPTSLPTPAPTSPTSSPTRAPVTSPANILNANPPTSPPTKSPTGTNIGEVPNDENLSDGTDGLNTESEPGLFDDLPFWVYIIAGCAGVCCCLTLIMVICKCKERKKNKGKVEFGMNYNSTNPPKESMDVWTNPVHHQVGSQSPVPMIAEGGGNNTTTGIHRVVSASDDVFDDDLSSQHENYGQMYTKSNRANIGFGENLSNNVAADDAVMDDIIGHMATPMGNGTIDDYDEDDGTASVEMAEMNTGGGGGRGENDIIIPDSLMNADNDDIDNINNNLINNDKNGNDEDVLDDIDMMGVTAGNDNDDDDDDDIIDDIDYDEDVVNDINDDMGDNIITPNNPNDEQHEEGGTYEEEQAVETIGGDLIDDDEFIIEDDDHGTPQDDAVLDDDELDYIGNGANDDDDNIVGDIDMMGVTAGGHDNDDDDDEVDDIDDIDDIDYDEDVVNNIDDFVHTIQ